MLQRLRRYGNLDAYADKSFDSFRSNLVGVAYTESVLLSLRDAKAQAQAFAAAPAGWLVLTGTYGCGKTHLAVAIANQRLEQSGRLVIFVTAPDLLDLLRTSFDSRSQTPYDEYFERIRRVSLLILDDLGLENPSAWAKEKLFQLLNFRHVNRLATVLTTNAALDELDPWLSSRMQDRSVVRQLAINAPDFRRNAASPLGSTGRANLQLYQHMRFDTFDTSSPLSQEAETLRRAKKLAQGWARQPKGWLCIMGDYGCGKTHLAAAIALDLQAAGRDVMFTTAQDLLDTLRMAFDPQSQARFDTQFDDILHCPLLILDDLRLVGVSDWAREKLFQILDFRYLTRTPTVITTSDTPHEMDSRLATRLMDRRLCSPFALAVRSFVKRQAPRR